MQYFGREVECNVVTWKNREMGGVTAWNKVKREVYDEEGRWVVLATDRV
jgi:hypothetical protein